MPEMSTPFSVMLSYAELAYLSALVGVEPTIGVDRNPFEGLSADEIAVAHTTARDALRARDLIRLDKEDLPLANDALLRMLGGYANPRVIVSAYRYVTDEELPLAWFGYLSEDATVIHTRPGDLLHALTAAPDVQSLARALIEFCSGGVLSTPAGAQLTLPARAIAEARASADAGDVGQVAQVLRTAGLDHEVAAALAADLSSPAAVTAITVAAIEGDADLRRLDAIYWQSSRLTDRLIVYTERNEVQISDGNDSEFLAILNEMM